MSTEGTLSGSSRTTARPGAPTVLVVEDEKTVAEVVDKYLRREGYCVSVSHDGAAALEHMRTEGADLLVLDLMLPGVDGLEVARRLRERGDRTPIIMLTAKDEESDIVLGLGLGADDYVSKPFSPRELVARVQAVLRRGEGSSASGPLIRTGDLRISVETRSVECAGQSLSLTAKEFDLLHFLATHPGQVFTRDQLLNRVWDYTYAGDTSTVTVHIRRLRSKVEADPERPRHIKTVWGVGYKFDV